MTKVTVRCTNCGYTARRALKQQQPGCRGVHETPNEFAVCPRCHVALVRMTQKKEE